MPHPSVSGGRVHRLAALVAAALLPVAAGCTASYGAQTQQPYDPGMGTNATSGENDMLKVRGAVAVVDDDGHGALVATIVNDGTDDALVGVAVADGSAELDPSQIDLERGAVARLGSDEPDAPTVALDGPALVPGHVVTVTLRFESAAPTRMDLQVVRNTGDYEDVSIPEPSSAPAHVPADAG